MEVHQAEYQIQRVHWAIEVALSTMLAADSEMADERKNPENVAGLHLPKQSFRLHVGNDADEVGREMD